MSSLLDEMKTFIGFTADDQARLAELHLRLVPHYRDIADRFYAAIERNPDARSVFVDRAQIERLKLSMVDWMESGLRGPHDQRFYDKRSRIGRRHVQIRLGQHHMFTAMNVIRTAYHERIGVEEFTDGRTAVHIAVDRLLDIELALMLRHYQLDSEERLIQRERGAHAEKMLAMQSLTAGLAHEVRNPLNAAQLQLELLERRLHRGGSDPKLVGPVGLAHHEIARLTAMLNEFLAFARPPQLSIGDHDLGSIIREVIDGERPLAVARGVTLLPLREGRNLVAEVDAGKIHQIVQNLVRNAIEAVQGRSDGRVELDVREVGHEDIIEVRDNGPGIAPEVAARIYEPFYSTKEGGTGMGMAIVHSLVALHAGRITVDTSSQGTRFFVHLSRRFG